MNRRELLKAAAGVMTCAATGALPRWAMAAREAGVRHILLRSSWQTVNIGDIAHTPGILRLFTRYLPDVKITLWPSSVDRGVGPMLLKNFPKLTIAEGHANHKTGEPTSPALKQAFAEADMLVHGSGPSVVARSDVDAWRKVTKKPYGIYGVTVGSVDHDLHDLLDHAAFVYLRDTISRKVVKYAGVTCPIIEFTPDATFAFDLRDDDDALKFLHEHDLAERKFMCAIPRLRFTPYYKIHHKKPTQRDLQRDAVDAKYAETDHAKLRGAMIQWVRKTGLKVLACPEMTYEVELAKQLLIDPLPDDVKPHVVWRDTYWRPDEVGSVYQRARLLVSFEMHSPIIAAAAGTPAIYLREPTDTSKGQMWRDIGLNNWIFEIDDTKADDIAATVLKIHDDYDGAQRELAKAMTFVHQRQHDTMGVVAKTVDL